MFSTIKAYIWAAGAALVTGLLIAVKVLAAQTKKAKRIAKVAVATVKRKEITQEREEEIDLRFEGLAEAERKALKTGEIPDHLRNPRD